MTTDTTTGLSEVEREMFDPIFTPGGPLDGVYAVAAKIAEGRLAKVQTALPDNSQDWTADGHRRMACSLLDGLYIVNASEDPGPNGEPERRFYTADVSSVRDDGTPEEPDLGPFLAALTHALLALTPADPREPGDER